MSEQGLVRNTERRLKVGGPSARMLGCRLSVALVLTAGLMAAAVSWPGLHGSSTARAAVALLAALLIALSVALYLSRGRLRREQRQSAAREAALQAMTGEVSGLVHALAAKNDAVSNVSHEFRTPLTSIIGNLDLVLADSGDLPPAAERRVEVAQRNAERLQALVSDLLASADTALDVHPRRTDLAGLVEASLGSAQAHAEASRVTLAMDVPAPLWAHADPLRISQALDNLVSNAIKYSPGGTVRVSAGHEDGRVLLHVTDDGMGMTADDAGQVFTRFFRSPAVREGAIPGVGLGLAITKAIVERHGGKISCRTQPGCGSTFTVELPAAEAPPSY